MTDDRDRRQLDFYGYVTRIFGEAAATPKERAIRLLEEVIELAQAEGVGIDKAASLVKYVYGRPAGGYSQELGGVGVCVLAYAESRGLSADDAELDEIARIKSIPDDTFRARHQRKADAGIAAAPTPRRAL